jgi:hypothetical protein
MIVVYKYNSMRLHSIANSKIIYCSILDIYERIRFFIKNEK